MKINFKLACLSAALAVGAMACKNKEKMENTGGRGIDLANLDTTVSPGMDFYQYANGGWLKNNPIPSTEARWGAFNELQENNYKILKDVLESAAKNTNAAKGSPEQLVGDFYASGMDSLKREKEGISALKPELDKIAAINGKEALLATVAEFQRKGINPMFSFYAYIDQKNSSAYITYATQGGLGLPDRDYYLKPDASSANIRKEYILHIAKMFTLAGDDAITANKQAEAIMKLETELAKASMTRVQLRDPQATYNKKTIAEINALTPSIDWTKHLAALNVPTQTEIVVGQPEFFARLNNLLNSTDLETWKTYLRWTLIDGAASSLNDAFVLEDFHFNGTVLNGTKELKPRWKRILVNVDGSLGDALGKMYVDKAFRPEAKERALSMVNNLGEALRERINGLDWMSVDTKTKALAKLNTFIKKIGYPDTWKDYKDLNISRESFVKNSLNANEFEFKRMISKLGKAVDKTEWLMTPPTVNAYYNPSVNEIVFPAGILQFPFYDPQADDAVNYGGIGAVIGHEMTHGFDDEGRQYDSEGNLKDWWTAVDASNFKKKTASIVKQYNTYSPLDSLNINGELTLGENIADIGGLRIAYEAFKKTDQYKKGEKIDGLSPDKRFFLAWAQVWRNNIRPEALKQRLVVDPHSPGKFRTNGVVSNMPEFYQAFNVKEGDKMFIPDSLRANIW